MLVAFCVALAAVLLLGLWTSKYEAQMKILVRKQRMEAMVTPQATNSMQFNGEVSEEELNSKVELVSSRDLLQKVVLAAGLQNRPHFAFGHPSDQERITRAVKKLGSDLTILPVRKADIIIVQYRSVDPELAAGVLTAVASAYTEK